jgi:hypothetical protein
VYFAVFPIEDHVRLVFPENWKLHPISGCTFVATAMRVRVRACGRLRTSVPVLPCRSACLLHRLTDPAATDLTTVSLPPAPTDAPARAESLVSGPDSGVSSATSAASGGEPVVASAAKPRRRSKRATFVPRKSADALSAFPGLQHGPDHPRLDAAARACAWLQLDVHGEKVRLPALACAHGRLHHARVNYAHTRAQT